MSVKSARFWKWFAITILALAVVYAVLQSASSRALRNAYLALEKDGRPMRADQILPHSVPDASNASLLYQASVLRLKAEAAGSSNLYDRLNYMSDALLKGAISDPQRDELRLLLGSDPVQSSLQLVREGLTRPACRFPIDYTKGAGILLPHLSELRELSHILCAQAQMQAQAGDLADAWETVLDSLRLATSLKKEPILISQLVRAAQFRLSSDTIRVVCRQGAPTDAQRASLTTLLEECADARPIVMAMDSERVLMGEWAFAMPAEEFRNLIPISGDSSPHGRAVKLAFKLLRMSLIWNRDHAAYLTTMHQFTKMAQNPFSAGDGVATEDMIRSIPRYCILTRLLVPALDEVKGRMIEAGAETRITGAGLTVLQYRQEKKTLPESLAEAGAGGFLDPFTGKPLLYKAAADGFTIYSVGPDLKDDSGSAELGADGKPRDLVWQL